MEAIQEKTEGMAEGVLPRKRKNGANTGIDECSPIYADYLSSSNDGSGFDLRSVFGRIERRINPDLVWCDDGEIPWERSTIANDNDSVWIAGVEVVAVPVAAVGFEAFEVKLDDRVAFGLLDEVVGVEGH